MLRELPGIAVADTGRRGGATSVFVRGGNSNYNLVMVDGIPLNQFGGDFDFSPLPTDGVAQVEVVRGAESALYGPDAVTSVVNLVTPTGEGAPHFDALAEGGSYDTYRLSTGGAGAFHGFSWSYDLSRLGSAGVVQNDNYRNQTAFVSLGYSRSPRRQFVVHFFGDANNAGVPGPYGSDPDKLFPGIDTVSRDNQNLFGYQIGETEQFSSRIRQVSTVSVSTDRYFFTSRPFGDSFENSYKIVANTRSEITLAPTDLLVAGFEYNREDYEDTFVADAEQQPLRAGAHQPGALRRKPLEPIAPLDADHRHTRGRHHHRLPSAGRLRRTPAASRQHRRAGKSARRHRLFIAAGRHRNPPGAPPASTPAAARAFARPTVSSWASPIIRT